MKNERGSILFMVIIFTIILSMVGLATIYMTHMEEIYARTELQKTQVFYLAEAGLERGRAWLQNRGQYPDRDENGNAVANIIPFRTAARPDGTVDYPGMTNGQYRVHIVPDPGNAANFRKKYTIVSQGLITNGAGAVTFGKTVQRDFETNNMQQYVYYSEIETSAGDDQNTFNNESNKNNYRYWCSDPSTMYFSDKDTVQGYAFANNQQMYFCAAPNRDLPQALKRAFHSNQYAAVYPYAWGFNGRCAPWALDIWQVEGRGTMLFDSWDNEIAALKARAQLGGRGLYVPGNCTINLSGGLGSDPPTVKVNNSLVPPDVALIFAEGNIELSQAAASRFRRYITIVSRGTVTIRDHILGIGSPSDRAVLGIVANGSIEIWPYQSAFGPRIHALMMTKAGFVVRNWNIPDAWLENGTNKNRLHISGGLVQEQRRPTGLIYGASAGTGLFSGLGKDYRYNNSLRDQIPPFFPLGMIIQRAMWMESPLVRGE